MRIPLLPEWILTGNSPAFYDSESLTAIQQTARLYGAVRELQQAYNDFTEATGVTLDAMQENLDNMSDTLNTFTATAIAAAEATAEQTVNNAIDTGTIVVRLDVVYDENTEDLTIDLLRGGRP